MSNKKQNKKGTGWGVLALFVILLLRALSNSGAGREAMPAVIGLFVFAVVAALVISAARKKGGADKHDHAQHSYQPGQPTVQTSRPVPSMQRREPVTAQRSFTKPDAYCVSCELSGEDHFVRDRQRRIAQLDSWLKNGLIDREEYQVLKRRFQNDQ